jgi:hypothetical protein
MTLVLSGAVTPAGAAHTTYQQRYGPAKQATSGQMKADVRILRERLEYLGESGVRVTLSHGDITLSAPSATKASEALADGTFDAYQLYFRPVLCEAYPLVVAKVTTEDPEPAKPLSGDGALPSCGAAYATNASNLDVTPNNTAAGYTSNNPQPDPTFANYTSSSYTEPNYESKTVLLPELAAHGTVDKTGIRYVLGPAEMTGASTGPLRPRRTSSVAGRSTTPWPAPRTRTFGTRWPRRTSTCCLVSS